jgi:hypothetical protein
MKNAMILTAALVMTIAPMAAFARGRIVVREPVFAGGYYGGNWGPGYGSDYRLSPYSGTGEVKFETKTKDASVFVNGGYAGQTKDVRSMHLRPGTYDITVRHPGVPEFHERVFVVAGKTLHLHPNL